MLFCCAIEFSHKISNQSNHYWHTLFEFNLMHWLFHLVLLKLNGVLYWVCHPIIISCWNGAAIFRNVLLFLFFFLFISTPINLYKYFTYERRIFWKTFSSIFPNGLMNFSWVAFHLRTYRHTHTYILYMVCGKDLPLARIKVDFLKIKISILVKFLIWCLRHKIS